MSIPVGVAPLVTEESEAFWSGLDEGHFVIERCTRCGLLVFPRCGVCRRCQGREMVNHEVAGPGLVYSWTVNHQRWMPGMDRPYGIALVDLGGGVRILGWVAEEDLGGLAIGAEVDLYVARTAAGTSVPAFRPRHLAPP